jgi:hypothetical protein
METISEIDKKKLIEMAYNELIEETEQEIKRLKKEYELIEVARIKKEMLLLTNLMKEDEKEIYKNKTDDKLLNSDIKCQQKRLIELQSAKRYLLSQEY